MRISPLLTSVLYATSNITTTTLTRARSRLPALPALQHQTRTVLGYTHSYNNQSRSMSFLSGLFSSSSSNSASKMSYPDNRSNDEWRAVLNKEQFRILREKGTEAPGSGQFDKHYPEEGVYACAGCATPLYKAQQKFKSGCGWPAYFDSLPGAVTRHTDSTLGMQRTEIVCSNCGGHLGHVFKGEGYPTPTDERHCVNSVSLTFSPEDKKQ